MEMRMSHPDAIIEWMVSEMVCPMCDGTGEIPVFDYDSHVFTDCSYCANTAVVAARYAAPLDDPLSLAAYDVVEQHLEGLRRR